MTAREECTCGKIPYQWARLVDPECKAVHHDETHGYHTADGEPVPGPSDVVEKIRCREGRGYCPFCQSNVLAHEDHHLLEDLEDAHVRITPDERDSLIAEIERLRSYLKEKECGGIEKLKYIQRLEAENAKLREAVLRLVFRTEVNCRIEHGAESGGHLEFVQEQLDAILDGKKTIDSGPGRGE